MGYVTETLSDGERLIHMAKFHWLYTATAITFLIVLGVVGIGVLIFLFMMINKWTTEIAITNKKLVYKRGWIARRTDEISLNKLEEVNLAQGIMGRIFGYGKLRIHGTGIGALELPNIDEPLNFRREIENAKTAIA